MKSLNKLSRELKTKFKSLIPKDSKKSLKVNRTVRKSILKCKSVKQKKMETIITTDFLDELKRQLKTKGEIFSESSDEPYNGSDFYVCFQELRDKTTREVFIHFQAKVLRNNDSYSLKANKKSSLISESSFFIDYWEYILLKTSKNFLLPKYKSLVDKILNEELTQLETQYYYSKFNTGVMPLYLFYIDWKNFHSQNKLYNYSNVMFSFTEALLRIGAHRKPAVKLADFRSLVFDFNSNVLNPKLLSNNGFFFYGKKLDWIFYYLSKLRLLSLEIAKSKIESSDMHQVSYEDIDFRILENSNLLETLKEEGHTIIKISV